MFEKEDECGQIWLGDPLACSIEILQVFPTIFVFFFFKKTYNPFLESQISRRGTLLKRRGKDRSGVKLAFLLCFASTRTVVSVGVISLLRPVLLLSCIPIYMHPLFSMFLVALSPPLSSSLENFAHSTM